MSTVGIRFEVWSERFPRMKDARIGPEAGWAIEDVGSANRGFPTASSQWGARAQENYGPVFRLETQNRFMNSSLNACGNQKVKDDLQISSLSKERKDLRRQVVESDKMIASLKRQVATMQITIREAEEGKNTSSVCSVM